MIESSDVAIHTRSRLADQLAGLIEADPRVRRWRRMEFADEGGALVVLELACDPGAAASQLIAREIEFVAAVALPRLRWVRVQVA